MIRSFQHKGLKRLYENDDPRGIFTEHVEKVQKILALLDAAETINELDLPGFRLYPLKGNMEGCWAIVVRANWRITFRFAHSDIFQVDYVDYH